MAPEQVRGRAVDARADIFAFGAVLYEMLTGKRAFRGESPVETLNAILKEDPPSLFESTQNVSPALERIVRRCLEKRAEERFRSAHHLGIALDAISTASTRSLSAETIAAAEGQPAGRGRLLERLGFLLAGAALAGGGMLAWEATHPAEPDGAAVFRWMSFSGRDSSPAVSPDGRTIAFTSDRDGQPRIWLKLVTGEGEAPLTTGPDDFPRFSPDGTQILCTCFEREYLARKLQENNWNISTTAAKIGIERSHLHRKMKSMGIRVGGEPVAGQEPQTGASPKNS